MRGILPVISRSRGFVAPNTGDRLCGVTVCAWAVQFVLLCETIFPLLRFQRSHASLLLLHVSNTWIRYLAISHAALQPRRWLSGVRPHHMLYPTGWVWRLGRRTILYSVLCAALLSAFRWRLVAWYQSYIRSKAYYIWRHEWCHCTVFITIAGRKGSQFYLSFPEI